MSEYFYITRNSGPFIKEGRREITEAEWRSAVIFSSRACGRLSSRSRLDHAVLRQASWAVWRSMTAAIQLGLFYLRSGDVEVKDTDDVA